MLFAQLCTLPAVCKERIALGTASRRGNSGSCLLTCQNVFYQANSYKKHDTANDKVKSSPG